MRETSAGSSNGYQSDERGDFRIFKRQSHIIDDLMERIRKVKDGVQ